MKKKLTILLSILLIAACSGGGSGPDNKPRLGLGPTMERITFSGAGDLGIFDPSLARDPGSGRLWMSYSSVATSSFYSPDTYWRVSLRLAFSDDNGASWQDAGLVTAPDSELTFAAQINEGHPTVDIPAGSKGIWQNETSSLIYDPSAPIDERWKLIWHQYLHANGTSFFADYSWIALKMASTPAGLASAVPSKLFGGIGLHPDSNITTSPPFAPTAGSPAIQLNSDLVNGANLTELSNCVFAEPELHVSGSALYLAIYCADATVLPATPYLVYFRCGSTCAITNAANWEYLGRLLTPSDAQSATDYHHFQAPSLVEKNGKTYLIVTPVDTAGGGDRYNGCRAYEFIDINGTSLVRNNGVLVERARVRGRRSTHSGACDLNVELGAETAGGILISLFDPKNTPQTFRIYKSNVSLP